MRLALLALLALAVLPCANAQVSTGTGFAVAPGCSSPTTMSLMAEPPLRL